MQQNEIKRILNNMKEGEELTFGKIKVKKILDFIEGGHGLDNLKYPFYQWHVEFGNENDKDYDGLHYTCHNDDSVNRCIKTILSGKICY